MTHLDLTSRGSCPNSPVNLQLSQVGSYGVAPSPLTNPMLNYLNSFARSTAVQSDWLHPRRFTTVVKLAVRGATVSVCWGNVAGSQRVHAIAHSLHLLLRGGKQCHSLSIDRLGPAPWLGWITGSTDAVHLSMFKGGAFAASEDRYWFSKSEVRQGKPTAKSYKKRLPPSGLEKSTTHALSTPTTNISCKFRLSNNFSLSRSLRSAFHPANIRPGYFGMAL